MNTFETYGFDGFAVLHDLVATSPFKTVEQAIASLALFSHPDTVAQTQGKALFRVVRSMARRGQVEEKDEGWIAYDDNKSPTDAFLWCNGLKASDFADVQFNHVYTDSQDPDQYTCLANLCVTPAFLAKLTDTHASVRALLQYRVFELYRWVPAGRLPPALPSGYYNLGWAPPLPPVSDVAMTVRTIMRRRPRDRTVLIVRGIGWLFSGYRPEPGHSIPEPADPAADGLNAGLNAGGTKLKKGRINDTSERRKLLALARFADVFAVPTFRFAETQALPSNQPGTVFAPAVALSEEALAFLRALEEHGWIAAFDWEAWANTIVGRALLNAPDVIAFASVDQLSKLLTALVRKERFSEGTLQWAFEYGLLTAVVRRTVVLAAA